MEIALLSLHTFLEKLNDKIQGVENEEELLIRLAVSITVFVGILLFRNPISGGLLSMIGKLFARRKKNIQCLIVDALKKPLSFFLLISALSLALYITAPSGEFSKISLYLIKIGAIVCVCWGGVRLLNQELSAYTFDSNPDSKTKLTAFRFISNVSKILIICIGALLILELFGYSASRIFAALGIGGVAVAFACKDTVENMISGFIIVFNKPFRVGDYITVGDQAGTVEDITVRTTTLLALDGSHYILPNTALTTKGITNWSQMEKRLITQSFCLHYKHSGKEIEAFEKALRALLLKNENVLPEDIRIYFSEYGAHGVEVETFYYLKVTAPAEYSAVKNDINLAIKKMIDQKGFELAYNSATVYIDNPTNDGDLQNP